MKKVKLFEQFIAEARENFNEIRELATGFGSLDPDILKDSKKEKFASNEDLIEYLSQYMDRYDSKDFLKQAYKKFTNESVVTEKREDVGKYNTVKKVIAKLGRRPSEQDLATFINNNYYDVTEVERGEDDPSANDKIADLVAFYKFDIDDWEIAWFDAQNESVVTEAKLKISGPAYDLWDDRDVQRKLKGVKIKIVGDIGGVATISGADDEIQKVKDILGLNESVVTEAKDNLYLQLHKKYAEQIKGLKAKKIKKLTDLVSVQRWSMEDREDYFDMDSKKKKELSAEYNEERKLFKKYVAGDESVMLPKGTEELAESVVNESADFGDLLKYEDNPYGIGASSVELEKGSHGNSDCLVFRCEDKGSRDEIEKKLKSMGFASKKMTKSTADKGYQYRYELTLFESVVTEAFSRMSKDTIENELYAASQALTTYYDWLKAGNDSGKGESIDHVISLLKKCKSNIKRFNKPEEVKGTAYESLVTEVVDLVHVYDEDGKMFGTGELVKTKGNKSLIRWDGSKEEWVDSKLVKVVESKESDALAKAIDKAIVKIDDSMSYKDFALAVGKILKEEYGSHNFEGFMEVLHKDLGI